MALGKAGRSGGMTRMAGQPKKTQGEIFNDILMKEREKRLND